MIHDYISIVYF